MASAGDLWMKEFNEEAKLADDISGMISEKSSTSYPGLTPGLTHNVTSWLHCESLFTKLPSKSTHNREKNEPSVGHAFRFAIENKPDGFHFEHVKFWKQRQFTWTRDKVSRCIEQNSWPGQSGHC